MKEVNFPIHKGHKYTEKSKNLQSFSLLIT